MTTPDTTWWPDCFGNTIHIDDYDNMPTATIAAVDIETNGEDGDKREIVCIGLATGPNEVWVYFNIQPELVDYLRKVQIIAHDGVHAEIPWLEHYGVTIDQLYCDTKIMYYVWDSTRKNYSLKPLIREIFEFEYPSYKELISDKAYIQWACEDNPGLLQRAPAPTKREPERIRTKLPKEVRLSGMPRSLVGSYNANDCLYEYRLWTWLRQRFTARHWAFFNNIEMPEARLIYEMEKQGVGVNVETIKKIHKEHSRGRRLSLRTVGIDRITANSNDKLGAYLYSQMGLACTKRTDTGKESVDEEALTPHKENATVKGVLEYRKHNKICTTYTIPLYKAAQAAPDGRIHTHFQQNTITGRLSSSDPVNLQNQPPAIREAFEARPGYLFIDADWSNIELRLPAHFSGEPGFISELTKPDGDLHLRTAQFIGRDRKIAKTCNFLLTNSGMASRLAMELECSRQEAEEIYRLFWAGYPVLKRWLDLEKKMATIRGGICTWFGRWVSIPQLRAPNEWVREEAQRSAVSVKVQGTAADAMKLASRRIRIQYGLIRNLTVHDELVYEVPEVEATEWARKIKHEMESVMLLKVPLVCNVGIGKTWAQAKENAA